MRVRVRVRVSVRVSERVRVRVRVREVTIDYNNSFLLVSESEMEK